MNVVLIVRGNPMASHRVCEGMRIALGLASSGHNTTLILAGLAPLLLTPAVHALVEGELAQKMIVTLKEFIPCVYIASESRVRLSDHDNAIRQISPDELAQKVTTSDYCMVFE